MGTVPAGTLTELPSRRLRFEYDAKYQARSNATPLSVSMPLAVRVHGHAVIHPWLLGLLPENPAVVERWSRRFHTSSTPFGLLGSPIGEDCAGAVRFLPPGRADARRDDDGAIEWLTEDDVAARLRDLRRDATSWLGQNFTGQFSLAGAQAKTALHRRDGRWGVPSGAVPTTHILKPAIQGLDDHDLNEHLCLDAARRAGLIAARTSIVRFADESAVVVERYDRVGSGDGLQRVHQEDLCQALGVDPGRKYQSDGGPAPAGVARLLRTVMPADVAAESILRFVDALAWNWLIAGTDAHAKNYSLLLAGDAVRLAPLYDVASALPYGVHERRLRLAMKLGHRYDVFPQSNEWPSAAADLGVDADTVVHRVRGLAASTPAAFAEAASAAERVISSDLPGRLVDLVSDRVDRCMRVLGSG